METGTTETGEFPYVVWQNVKYSRYWWFWRTWRRDGDPYFEEITGGAGWDDGYEAYNSKDEAEAAAKAAAQERGWHG